MINNKYFFWMLFGFVSIISSCNKLTEEYYDTGELKSKYYLKDNKLNGLKQEFYKNGNVAWEVVYMDNLENGIFKEYLENGILVNEAEFKQGKQFGLTKEYYDNGRIKRIIPFKNGIENGLLKEYFLNGNIKLIIEFDSGKTVSYISYDSLGFKLKEAANCASFNYKDADPIVEFKNKNNILCAGVWEYFKISFKNQEQNKYLKCVFPMTGSDVKIKDGENVGEFYIKYDKPINGLNIMIVCVKDWRKPNNRILLKQIQKNVIKSSN